MIVSGSLFFAVQTQILLSQIQRIFLLKGWCGKFTKIKSINIELQQLMTVLILEGTSQESADET